MIALRVSGHLRTICDRRAVKAGYMSWGDFIKELHLEEEEVSEAMEVLKDMEEGDLDTIGRGD